MSLVLSVGLGCCLDCDCDYDFCFEFVFGLLLVFVESFGCTVNGEVLIQRIFPFWVVSFDPESLKEEILEIPSLGNLTYIANFNDSLVLLDGVNISS